MEFLSLEAEKDGFQLPFSDDKTENTTNEIGDFINDDPIEEEDVSFYRERDPLNLDDYPKFNSQIRNPIEAIFSDDESYFGEDEQPENKDTVVFDKLNGSENFSKNLKRLHKIFLI